MRKVTSWLSMMWPRPAMLQPGEINDGQEGRVAAWMQ